MIKAAYHMMDSIKDFIGSTGKKYKDAENSTENKYARVGFNNYDQFFHIKSFKFRAGQSREYKI